MDGRWVPGDAYYVNDSGKFCWEGEQRHGQWLEEDVGRREAFRGQRFRSTFECWSWSEEDRVMGEVRARASRRR